MFNHIKDKSNTFKNLINGEWVSSRSGNFIEIKSPLDNSLIGRVPAMAKEEVDIAVQTAKEAQRKWKNTTIDERAEILYKAADILLGNIDELSELMMMEIIRDMVLLMY